DIIIGSKSKKELIKKLSKDDPEYLIENLQNIERVADIIYEPQKNIKKRKKEEEFSSSEEETEKQRPKKNTRVKKELAKEEIDDTDEIMKMVGDKWKTDIEKS
ncbi:25364_t:CDS:1, partial [Gigaspora margarita]